MHTSCCGNQPFLDSSFCRADLLWVESDLTQAKPQGPGDPEGEPFVIHNYLHSYSFNLHSLLHCSHIAIKAKLTRLGLQDERKATLLVKKRFI